MKRFVLILMTLIAIGCYVNYSGLINRMEKPKSPSLFAVEEAVTEPEPENKMVTETEISNISEFKELQYIDRNRLSASSDEYTSDQEPVKGLVVTEKTNSSSAWSNNDDIQYAEGVISYATSDGKLGFMNYNGEPLYNRLADKIDLNDIHVVRVAEKSKNKTVEDTENMSGFVFSDKAKEEMVKTDFTGIDDTYILYEDKSEPIYGDLSLSDNKFYVTYQDGEETKTALVDYNKVRECAETTESNIVVRYEEDNGKGIAVLKPDMGILCKTFNVTTPDGADNVYVNGFVKVINRDLSEAQRTQNMTYGFVKAETGMLITRIIYEDAKWFEDGYAPVKKNGKWGYIDENGTEVTDFIFDDASVLFDGKAFVKYGNDIRILNLKDALNAKIKIDTSLFVEG